MGRIKRYSEQHVAFIVPGGTARQEDGNAKSGFTDSLAGALALFSSNAMAATVIADYTVDLANATHFSANSINLTLNGPALSGQRDTRSISL